MVPSATHCGAARRVLYVAYSLLPVTEASCGGAEQMLSLVENRMNLRGHCTAVAACAGSEASGRVLVTGSPPVELDAFERRDAEHNARIVEHVSKCRSEGAGYDLIHDHSGSFWKYAAAVELPVLATLHLPRDFYPEDLLGSMAQNLYVNCVSESQARTFAGLPRMLGVVRNGIALERFPFTRDKRDYVLWMGRICEEKGPHLAIQAADQAGVPLVIAGQVYPFSYHQKFFEREILPHLGEGSTVRFVERPAFVEKVELLRHARALLVPSLVPETGSLVSLEAMACGTPVIGFCRGAIPEVVAEGETGFLVENAEQMAAAIHRVGSIPPDACRMRVHTHYAAARMAEEYEELYRRVLDLTSAARPLAA